MAIMTRCFVIDALFGIGDANFSQERNRLFAGHLLAHALVQNDGFHDLRTDGEHGIERRHRLLKDHADVAPADRLHFALGQAHQIAAEKRDAARLDLRVRGQEPHDR
jgi:hypothetical protein